MLEKKIIITITNDINFDQRIIRIATYLQSKNYDVLVLSWKTKQSIPIRNFIFENKRINPFFQKGKFRYLIYNLQLFFILLTKKYDILYSVDVDTLYAAFFCTGIKKRHWVYDAHEYFTQMPEVMDRPITQKIWNWIEKKSVPKTNARITVGNQLANIFKEKFGKEYIVIRNIPESKPKLIVEKEKWVIYQGWLNEGRGLEQSIEAMQYIEAMVLVIVGDGPLKEKLEEKVRKLDLSNKVRFLGKILPDNLHKITSKAKIGLNLLENKGLSYYNSLANKHFDYVMAGIPTINMDFPEYRFLDKEFKTGLLLSSLEPKIIAQAINFLIKDKHFYMQCKEKCNLAAVKWNWTVEKKKLDSIFL